MYRPATHGLPVYFIPMTADSDRNERFELAIDETICEFKANEGRAPRVLDFGCGSGMLTLIALQKGAAHVTGVDCNRDMLPMARELLKNSGYQEDAQFNLLEGVPAADGSFDMLISEVIGTLTTSEGAYNYWKQLETHMCSFSSKRRWYTVPQRLEQTAAVYRFPHLHGKGTERACRQLTFESVFKRESSARLFASNETGLPFHEYSHLNLTQKHIVCVTNLGQELFLEHAPGNAMVIDPLEMDNTTLLVFEWTAKLSTTVTLHNTLTGYSDLPVAVRSARAIAWGFMLAYLKPTKHLPTKVTFTIARSGMIKAKQTTVRQR